MFAGSVPRRFCQPLPPGKRMIGKTCGIQSKEKAGSFPTYLGGPNLFLRLRDLDLPAGHKGRVWRKHFSLLLGGDTIVLLTIRLAAESSVGKMKNHVFLINNIFIWSNYGFQEILYPIHDEARTRLKWTNFALLPNHYILWIWPSIWAT